MSTTYNTELQSNNDRLQTILEIFNSLPNASGGGTTTPANGDTLGLVKSGGDVTISNGIITVNDDSHNHTIANVDGLQTALDSKEASGALTEAKSYTDTKVSSIAAGNITSGTLAVARGGTGQTSLADTTYTTARYRGSALYSTETTPTVNGVIYWIYG